nr:gamma subclass chorismate mutase AroQ [uncultured Chryseobacterium sp.]
MIKKLLKVILFIFFLGNITSCINRYEQKSKEESLLKLIDKRLKLAPLVAKSKWNTKAAIDDPVREKIILDSVKVKAQKMGLNENLAVHFFQAQFEAGKIVQRQLHHQWKSQNQAPFSPAPNLATDVRPVLDSLTPLLLMELKKNEKTTLDAQSIKRLRKEARKIISPEFTNDVVETAIKPLEIYGTSQ